MIDEWDDHNLVVDQGLNHLLGAVLGGGSQIATWHVGIFEGDRIPVTTDVASDFAVNAVESIAYDESFRPVWDSGAVEDQQITNRASRATFTINAAGVLISEETKGGADGVLFAASRFS